MLRVDEPAGLLWHYTDAAGLQGIISSRKLRLGNARFLNDRTELTFGWNILASVIESRMVEIEAACLDIDDLALSVKDRLDSDGIFVTSFAENGDVLSQWSRYGAQGCGYSLGFDFTDLVRWGAKSKPLALRRVLYSEPDQRLALDDLLREGLAAVTARVASASDKSHEAELRRATTEELVATLSTRCATLKNPDFVDEQEWRLVRSVNTGTGRFGDEPIVSVVRENYVKPCIDVDVASVWRGPGFSEELPLRAITCGPKLDPALATGAVRYSVLGTGLVNVVVESSSRALR